MNLKISALVVALVGAITGCSSPDSSIPDGAELVSGMPWSLLDEAPDGHRLLVGVSGAGSMGGGCFGMTDWLVQESAVQVAIGRSLWVGLEEDLNCSPSVPGGLSLIELREPLADRELVGCGRPSCLDKFNSADFDPIRVEAVDGRFVASTRSGPLAIDPTGAVEAESISESLLASEGWERAIERRRSVDVGEHAISGGGVTVVGGHDKETTILDGSGEVMHRLNDPLGPPSLVWERLALFDRGARLTAVNIDTGEIEWVGRGFAVEWTATDSAIYSVRSRSLLRIDPHTGEIVWRVDLGPPEMHAVAADGDLVVVSAPLHLDAYDAATGVLRWSTDLPWPAG